MKKLHIRQYKQPDWACLCQIHDAARLHELSLAGCSDAFLPLQETAKNEGLFDGEVMVALDANATRTIIVGFVAYTLDQLGWLYTQPSQYRKGVGRQLVQHVIRHTGPVLELEVLQGNTPAIALYLSEGFKIVETRKRSVIMRRERS